jgi:hypothetical protein
VGRQVAGEEAQAGCWLGVFRQGGGVLVGPRWEAVELMAVELREAEFLPGQGSETSSLRLYLPAQKKGVGSHQKGTPWESHLSLPGAPAEAFDF